MGRQTALHAEHIRLGAKMIAFHGWELPVQYRGLVEEHLCVREQAGLFDLSHMGELSLTGPTAAATLGYLTANDPSQLQPGEIQYSPLLNEQGGIVDDILIYRTDDGFFLVVNASNVDKDRNWIAKHLQQDSVLEDVSDATSLIAIQGPAAAAIAGVVLDESVLALGYYHFADLIWQDFPVRVSRTGYTGEDGFELYLANEGAVPLWQALMQAGEPRGLQPIGLGARDTLRLEMRMPLYGNDIDDTTTPLEAGLGRLVAWDRSFIGREELLQQKEAGVRRRLVGFVLSERGIARPSYPICDGQGQRIGVVTSGSMSPSRQQAVGMGYVPPAAAKPGSELFIEIRGRRLRAAVHKGRFVQTKK